MRLWKCCACSTVHSIASSGASWWIAANSGLSSSVGLGVLRATSKRGSVSYVAVVGGGIDSLASHARSERLSGSAARRWLSAVVPLRGMPTRISGVSTFVAASSGWVRCQSRTRRRLARFMRIWPSNASSPISVRSASCIPDHHSGSSPSRNVGSP